MQSVHSTFRSGRTVARIFSKLVVSSSAFQAGSKASSIAVSDDRHVRERANTLLEDK